MGASKTASTRDKKTATGAATMEAIVDRENMWLALRAVEGNAGAVGVDGTTTGQLRGYLGMHWEQVRRQLLAGERQPQAVRREDIPKPEGGRRMLGIPTVLDRLLQQALH